MAVKVKYCTKVCYNLYKTRKQRGVKNEKECFISPFSISSGVIHDIDDSDGSHR